MIYQSHYSIQVTVHRLATLRLVWGNRAQEVALVVIHYLDILGDNIVVTLIQEFQLHITLWVMLTTLHLNPFLTTKTKS